MPMHFIVNTRASNSDLKNKPSSVCEWSSLLGFVFLFIPDCLGAWESVLEIVRQELTVGKLCWKEDVVFSPNQDEIMIIYLFLKLTCKIICGLVKSPVNLNPSKREAGKISINQAQWGVEKCFVLSFLNGSSCRKKDAMNEMTE